MSLSFAVLRSPFSNVQCPLSVVLEAQCPLHKQLEGPGEDFYHDECDEQAVVIRRAGNFWAERV